MKIPIIKYSDKFLNAVSWLFKVGGITLWPFIVLREKYRDNDFYRKEMAPEIITHETIHIKQQQELLIIFFYLWYVIEFFLRIFIHKGFTKAYKNISFEREAYANEHDNEYINRRSIWAFLKYLRE